jgi:serine/threonine-protein kinase HipA
VQFLPEDNVASGEGQLVPINETGIAARLRKLRTDPGAWTPRHAAGQFSLAGAQAKIALRRVGEDWFEAAGAEPTSHILKLPMPGFAHQALNEHLCLRTAALLGIPAAASEVADFDGEQAIVVTRFDRAITSDGRLVRVHQEDMCQALAEPPSRKYQSDGGPGPVEIAALLRRVLPPARARTALGTFLEALALAWALAGTDAHAKNYGLLLAGEQVRLAPLYDLNSALPYQVRGPQAPGPGQLDPAAVRLAMAVGGQSRPANIDADSWRKLADQLTMPEDVVLELVGRVVEELPDALGAAVDELTGAGLGPGQRAFAEQMLRSADRSAQLRGSALRGRGPRRRS